MAARERPTSLIEALTLIKSNGWATVQEMADWAGVDVATVYAWLQPGGPEPRWNSIRLIFRHCDDDRTRMALADAFCAGTSIVCRPTDHMQIPGTAEAIKDGLLDAINELTDFAMKAKQALADGIIDAADRTILQAEAEQARAMLDTVLLAINAKAESDQKRRGIRIAGAGA